MALKGIKVVEFLGLAPGPFCGMLLADFGASVTIVDKISPSMGYVLGNGKRSLAVNLKTPAGVKIVRELCKTSDVLIEPFRPGVMEKNGLGPNILLSDNPRLIYARLTGYGQHGKLFKSAGHDINYLALSGFLSLLGRPAVNPLPPINFAADFAGGGLMCALGIVMALFERTKSHKGQIIDASMVEGAAYVSSWIFRSQKLPIWGKPPGENVLDGGYHFYNTYKTKDEKYMAVGALEPKFYDELQRILNLSDTEYSQFEDTEKQKEILSNIFIERSQSEWCKLFDGTDACVAPVLSIDEAPLHAHNTSRKSFIQSHEGNMVPNPAPLLSRTPASSLAGHRPPHHGEHTEEILKSLQYTKQEIQQLQNNDTIFTHPKSNL